MKLSGIVTAYRISFPPLRYVNLQSTPAYTVLSIILHRLLKRFLPDPKTASSEWENGLHASSFQPYFATEYVYDIAPWTSAIDKHKDL